MHANGNIEIRTCSTIQKCIQVLNMLKLLSYLKIQYLKTKAVKDIAFDKRESVIMLAVNTM